MCDDCRRIHKRARQRDEFYSSKEWRRTRRLKLALTPLCEQCIRIGMQELATEVDHIVKISDGGAKLSMSNLQSLCKPHHSQKTANEREKKSI